MNDFLYEPQPWMDQAVCTTVDPDLFFPSESMKATRPLDVCSRCRVRQDCLEYAVETGPVDGVWGGTTANDRQLMRRGLPVLNAERSCAECGGMFIGPRQHRYCSGHCTTIANNRMSRDRARASQARRRAAEAVA
ncbi:MAG: WhiB family transcriptional regulator [Acidimicrobiales bacterium]